MINVIESNENTFWDLATFIYCDSQLKSNNTFI